jgi:hypothetical protein
VGAAIHDEVQPILAKTGADEPDDIVRPLVLAAVERVIGRWQRGEEISRILTSAGTDWLPYAARGTRTELSIWQVRSMEAADAAMGALRADASVEELRCVAKEAAGKIAAEFDHQQRCEAEARRVGLHIPGGTPGERDQAEGAVRKAFAGLAVTSSEKDLVAARDAAIAPIRQQIAARLAEQAQQAAAQTAARQAEQRREQHDANKRAIVNTIVLALPWDGAGAGALTPAAAAAVREALDRLPAGATHGDLTRARDQALAPYLDEHTRRRRKEETVAAALRELPSCLRGLEHRWDFDGATVESLVEEFKPRIRKGLEAGITGTETPPQMAMLLRRLVERQLRAAPAPALAR